MSPLIMSVRLVEALGPIGILVCHFGNTCITKLWLRNFIPDLVNMYVIKEFLDIHM